MPSAGAATTFDSMDLLPAMVGAGLGLLWAPVAQALVDGWPQARRPAGPVFRHWRGAIRSRGRPRVVGLAAVCAGAGAAVLGGLSLGGLAVIVVGLALVPVVAIDLEHLLIPDIVILPAAALAVLFGALAQPSEWWTPIAWGATAGGALASMWMISPSGIGLGDAKLALLLGAALGPGVLPALVAAFVLGGFGGAWLLLHHGAGARGLAIPFGPFLAAGAVFAVIGDPWLWG